MLSAVVRNVARRRSSATALMSQIARANQHEHPQAIKTLAAQRHQSTSATTINNNSPNIAAFVERLEESPASASSSASSNEYLSPRDVEKRFVELDTFVRKFGRITRSDYDRAFNALLQLKNLGLPISPTQVLMLVRCCGQLMCEEPPSVREDLISKAWSTFSPSTKLDISHYNSLLKVYSDNNSTVDPSTILKEIESRNLTPNRVTYQRLIHLCCQRGDMKGATQILEIMKSKDVPINENVFNSLILGYGRAGDIESADLTLKSMKESGVEPSGDTYTSVISAYAERLGQFEEYADKIRSLIKDAANDDVILTKKHYFAIIDSVAKSNEASPLIDELLEDIPKGMGYNLEAYRAVLNLICIKKVNAAIKILKTMSQPQAVRDKKFSGTFMIKQLVKLGATPSEVLQVCKELQQEDLHESGVKVAAHAALQYGDHSAARTYLHTLAETEGVKPHYFWPLIARADSNNLMSIIMEDLPLALGTYAPMFDTFSEWIWPRVNQDPYDFIEKCRPAGYMYSTLLASYIDYQIANYNVSEALEVLTNKQYEGVRIPTAIILRRLADETTNINDPGAIASIIQALTRRADSLADPQDSQTDFVGRYLLFLYDRHSLTFLHQFSRLKPEFEKRELYLSSESARKLSLKTRISEADAKEMSSLISDTPREVEALVRSHRRDETRDSETRFRVPSDIEGLERLLEEQKSRQQDTTLTRQKLLTTYCRAHGRTNVAQDNKDRAQNRIEELLEEVAKDGDQLGPGALTALMDFYAVMGNLEKALEFRSRLPESFSLDTGRVLDLAAALTKAGRLGDALSLIQEEISKGSSKTPVNEDSDEDEGDRLVVANLSRKSPLRGANRFLTAVAEETKDVTAVRDALKLVLDYTNERPKPMLMNCLIKVHILNDDIQKAVEEFCNCCEAYRCTPYRKELMKHLLQSQDKQNLQKVIDAAQKIFGEHSILFTLAMACIEAGKLKQAKKVLETQGLQINLTLLETQCQDYAMTDKAKELEDLISVTRDTIFDYHRDNMYYHLLRLYAKNNDAEKALNAWTTMQEEDMHVSGRNMRLIAKILKDNGIEPPFEVPRESAIEDQALKRQDKRSSTMRMSKQGEEFQEAIKNNDLSTALQAKEKLERIGKGLTLAQFSLLIEALVKNERLKEAYAMTQKLLIEKHFPSPRTVRFLLTRLASAGDTESLHNLREYIPNSISDTPWFTSLLSNAYINAGRVEELMEKVLPNISPFPVGGILGILAHRPDLEEKVEEMAKKRAFDDDFIQPLNMVWIHYMRSGKYERARKIIDSTPKLKEKLLFNDIVEKVREDNDVTLAQELVNQVKTSSLTPRAIGLTYSSLIEALANQKEYEKAEEILLNDIAHRETTSGSKQPLLSLSDINRRVLQKLQQGIQQNLGRDARFDIPTQYSRKEPDVDPYVTDDEMKTATQRPA